MRWIHKIGLGLSVAAAIASGAAEAQQQQFINVLTGAPRWVGPTGNGSPRPTRSAHVTSSASGRPSSRLRWPATREATIVRIAMMLMANTTTAVSARPAR